jgi:hypothetical protein
MKKYLLYLLLIFAQNAFSQTKNTFSPLENEMTDSLCDCVTKLDLSKIKGKAEAIAAYTNCIAQLIK